VLAYTAGAVPGGELAADKAAAQAQAAQYPTIAALKGQQDLAAALWQQGQDMQKIEAQRPGLYQQAAQDIRANNAARASAALQQRQDQISNQLRQETLSQGANQFAQTRADRAAQFAVTQRQKAVEFAATQAQKKAAQDFLDWYRTEGVNQSQAKINQKAAEFGVTASQKNAAQDFLDWYRTEGVNQSQAKINQKAAEFGVTASQKNAAQDFLDWYRTEGVNQSQAKINQKAAEFGVTASQKNAQIKVAQQNANTRATVANNAATKANNAAMPKFSASVSRSLGYRADQYGNPLGGKVTLLPGFGYAKNGSVVKASSSSTAKTTGRHGLSASKVLTLKGDALTIAQNAAQGIKPGQGPTAAWNTAHPNGLAAITWQQATTEMEQSGIPAWVYIPALNRYFKKPGDNPYMSGPPAPPAV
jgi:hypothetical protein